MSVKLLQIRTVQSEFNGEFAWQAAGMSYLIQTEGNRFIVIDGGFGEDVPHLLETMRRLSGENIPRVALWILTHPHGDHYLALTELSKNPEWKASVQIGRLCYQMPKDLTVLYGTVSAAPMVEAIREMEQRLGVPVITPHTMDVLDIDGVTLTFYFTPEDCGTLKDVNELSLIFKVNGPNRSAMFTGDAYGQTTRMVCYRFWDELKSDILQLAHHGLNGGSAEFYAKVDAETVMIPISESGDRYVRDLKAGYVARLFAERQAKKVLPAYQGDCELIL